jgi:hypothetical protein
MEIQKKMGFCCLVLCYSLMSCLRITIWTVAEDHWMLPTSAEIHK